MSNKIKVLLVEDHEMTRLGLQVGIEKAGSLELIGEAIDGIDGVHKAQELRPDVILMDIGLPKIDGIEATKRIRDLELDTKILMFTSRENSDDVFAALAVGADGYVTKGTNIEQLIIAISAIYSGASYLDSNIAKIVLNKATQNTNSKDKNTSDFIKNAGLTKREVEVLKLIADGMDNSEISDKLVIEIATTKAHVHNILAKLCVRNRNQATILAVKEGII